MKMKEETKYKLKFGFGVFIFVIFLLWVALNVSVRLFQFVVISYGVMSVSYWALDKISKLIPSAILSVTLAVFGTLMESLSFNFMEYPMIFSSILIYANVGQAIYLFLQKQLKLKLMRLY